jgi:hypothetical protein
MKKSPRSKLVLNRDTFSELDRAMRGDDLAHAHGGNTYTCGVSCGGTCIKVSLCRCP